MLLAGVVLLFGLLDTSTCQGPRSDGGWTFDRFPDPSVNPDGCGRQGPSMICDPNGIITQRQADQIDDILKSTYNDTSVPCYDTKGSKRRGYIVMMALMPKIQHYFNLTNENKLTQTFREGRFFAYYLSKAWADDACNATVIILYSSQDGFLYTSTQSVAREKLPDVLIQEIALRRARYFRRRNPKIALGLKRIAMDYKKVLSDTYKSRKPKPSKRSAF